MSNVLEPLKIYHMDCRSSKTGHSRGGIIRFIQWNIERGYKFDGIIKEIIEIDAGMW
jgi:hypothetical protein